MVGKNIGNLVASEMLNVLDSTEYKSLFTKEAAPSLEKKAEAPAIEVKEASAKQMFQELTNKFVSLSRDLDYQGFNKTASIILTSLEVLLKEAAGDPSSIEQMLEEVLEGYNPNFDVEVDIDMKSPVDLEISDDKVDERLMMEDEEGLSLLDEIEAIDALGLDEVGDEPLTETDKKLMKEVGLGGLAKDIREANEQLDLWLSKYANEHMDSLDSSCGSDMDDSDDMHEADDLDKMLRDLDSAYDSDDAEDFEDED